jgi:hypothetical protein
MITRQAAWIAALMLIALVAGAALAAPPMQGPILPTPTLHPVENVTYTLDTVGGQAETHTFAYADQSGFILGEATVSSNYPRGMVFTLNPQSANGAITAVTLLVRYVSGFSSRVIADWDAGRGAWVAEAWPTGDQHPAWAHFDFRWRVGDASGAAIETEEYPMDYTDITRQWYRLETPYMLVYWFGLSDDDPDRFARRVTEELAATQERRIAGFGRAISYRPVGVIYGTRAEMGEMTGSGAVSRGGAYYDIGMSVLPVPEIDRLYQEGWLSFATAHELVHLYQSDVLGGLDGPEWWIEGQAQWFAPNPGLYDERLRHLATLQDLPTLTKEIPRYIVQADGRVDLAYYMGASFINWLLTHYGGLELHAQVVALMAGGVNLYDALETATGAAFFDLENDWRAYIGLPPFELADIDPAAALQPPLDPIFAVGDSFTLPATTPLLMFYQEPRPNALIGGQCYANMTITVQQVGSVEGVDYYQIECMGQVGWLAREQIAGFKDM